MSVSLFCLSAVYKPIIMRQSIALIYLITSVFLEVCAEGHYALHMKCRCELDVDGTHRGSAQIHFDGDHVHLYLNTSGNWTTDNAKAQRVIEKWDPEGKMAEHWKHFLKSTCSSWLELFVHKKIDTEERKANHVLQYVTTITPAINSSSGELDGERFVYYGSNVTEVILKTKWIKTFNKSVPNYCNSEKFRMLGEYDDLQHLLNQAVEVFSDTKNFLNTPENKDPPTDESQRSHVITAVVFVIFFIVNVALFIKYWVNSEESSEAVCEYLARRDLLVLKVTSSEAA